MKARYRYRIYPTPGQQMALAKLFGCVRVVWNDALAFCLAQYKAGEKKPKNTELQKQFITQAKRAPEREWLSQVSCVPEPVSQSLSLGGIQIVGGNISFNIFDTKIVLDAVEKIVEKDPEFLLKLAEIIAKKL